MIVILFFMVWVGQLGSRLMAAVQYGMPCQCQGPMIRTLLVHVGIMPHYAARAHDALNDNMQQPLRQLKTACALSRSTAGRTQPKLAVISQMQRLGLCLEGHD